MVHFTERCAEYDRFSIRTRVATVVETLDVGHALARKLHVTVSKRSNNTPRCNAIPALSRAATTAGHGITLTTCVRLRIDLEFDTVNCTVRESVPVRGSATKRSDTEFPVPTIESPSPGSHRYSSAFSLHEASMKMVSFTRYVMSSKEVHKLRLSLSQELRKASANTVADATITCFMFLGFKLFWLNSG
jgi:hypothetical protein